MKKGITIVLITIVSILTGLNNINASELTNMEYVWAKEWNLTSFDNNITFTKTSTHNFNYYKSNQVGNVKSRIWLKSNDLYHNKNFDNYYFLINIKNTNNEVVSNVTSTNSYLIKYNNLSLSFGINYSDNTFLRCMIYQNYGNYFTLQCPNHKQNVSFNGIIADIETEYENSPQFTQSFEIGISRDVNISTSTSSSINNSINETNDILTGEKNYNKDASEEVNGKEEIDDYTEKEEELFKSLDFEGIKNNEIIINPNTSSFIWEIIDRLRGMNGKIILLMTSILGLGIIKMVLNR